MDRVVGDQHNVIGLQGVGGSLDAVAGGAAKKDDCLVEIVIMVGNGSPDWLSQVEQAEFLRQIAALFVFLL
ncbi:hypothetical protein CLOM621_07414 [Clostridium sp. M62/1]|nr:hypothetical protein CLOM621_07414 [Clostridium sp. M62/1]